MLKYTVAAWNTIVNDMKLISKLATIIMQSFMIVYLTLGIIFTNGNVIVNSVLLGLTVVHFGLYLCTDGKKGETAKRVKGVSSKVYTYAKLMINAVSLASIIYSIYVSPDIVSSITLVTTPLMIVLWVLQLLFELVKIYVERRATLFIDGIKMDFEVVIKPLTKARNLLHDFIGEEREAEDTVTESSRRILTEQASIDEEEKKKKPKNIFLRAFDEVKRRVRDAVKKKPDATEGKEEKREDEYTTSAK